MKDLNKVFDIKHILNTGKYTIIGFDKSKAGVLWPKNQYAIVGLNTGACEEKIRFSKLGIHATVMFNDQSFRCSIPWYSIQKVA
jgi:hypothetical protein